MQQFLRDVKEHDSEDTEIEVSRAMQQFLLRTDLDAIKVEEDAVDGAVKAEPHHDEA